jgi:Polyketide cyclase / dehydrase and lipid transport
MIPGSRPVPLPPGNGATAGAFLIDGLWPGAAEGGIYRVTRYARVMRGSVTVHMAAPADRVWDVVSDITRVGEFSPETFEAEWLGGASGPELGARFRGHVRRNGRGPVYWTVCTVVACDSGREFAFAVGAGKMTVITWRYQLEPTAEGTDVTESFELADKPVTRLYWMIAGFARGRTNRNGMRATLEKIKAVTESSAP